MDVALYVIGAAILGIIGYTGFKLINRSKNVSAKSNSIAAGRDVRVKSQDNNKK